MNERKLDRPKVTEIAGSKETLPLPNSNRVVVFGAVLTGAYELAQALQEYLQQQGVVNPEVETYKMFFNIEAGFYGILGKGGKNRGFSLPKGVLAFPEMRDWGETVKTPFGFIQDLCEKHGVPFVKFDAIPTLKQLQDGMPPLLLEQRPLNDD